MSTHLARIAKIDKTQEIVGADKIQIAFVLGAQVIVAKDLQVGDIGLFFDGELALFSDYLSYNNLYRDSAKNKDKNKTGFFEDNGRVRVQKFLKTKSEGLFMPLSSLDYTKTNISKLALGDAFDEINGNKICEKYISIRTRAALANKMNAKKQKEVDTPLFKQHVDTEQLAYYVEAIPKGSIITFEHKVHGTSGRSSYTKIVKNLPKWKTYINKFFPIFKNEFWEYVTGSRRVTLFKEASEKIGFHGSEQYRFEILEQLKPYLTKGLTVYYEIFGFVNGSPIMGKHDMSKLKDKEYTNKYGNEIVYKYGCVDGKYRFKIYRITLTSDDGETIDFTSPQVIAWCETRGFIPSKPLIPPFIYDGDSKKLMELAKELAERPDKLCEDYLDASHINEGVIVRVDYSTKTPLFLKYKSFPFKVLEGIAKDTQIDTEDAA
jgi:hypothetical protein